MGLCGESMPLMIPKILKHDFKVKVISLLKDLPRTAGFLPAECRWSKEKILS